MKTISTSMAGGQESASPNGCRVFVPDAEVANVDATLAQLGDLDPARGELAANLFDWTQKAAEVWRGSNNAVRRRILDSVCLNRTVSDVNLYLEKRKPFGDFAERPVLENSRGDRI